MRPVALQQQQQQQQLKLPGQLTMPSCDALRAPCQRSDGVASVPLCLIGCRCSAFDEHSVGNEMPRCIGQREKNKTKLKLKHHHVQKY